jgi:diaminopimelate decarboxylase
MTISRPFFLDHDAIAFTARGELTLAGLPVSELASRFGTPLVVLLEDVIRQNCREYQARMHHYPRSRVYFASKAFLTTGFCRLLMQEGLGLDVVSAGELATAEAAGFPMQQVMVHGNAKTRAEMEYAVRLRVGRIVIDNLAEAEALGGISRAAGIVQDVHVRVTPGVKPSTHEYIQTGQIDSKFGFNLAGGAAEEAVRAVLAQPSLRLVGIHCHIGSQIYDTAAFELAAGLMLEFYARARGLGAPLDELNLGGGAGIRYQPGDAPPSIASHVERVAACVRENCARLGLVPPVLCDEPGRSIVGEAGVTLYTVQSVKRVPGVRNYAGLDGGMTDNPRYALYGARHYAMRASNAPEADGGIGDEMWSLSGKCCETGDMLIKDTPLPPLSPGDIVAMFSTGAYTYSMASHYNRVPKPAVVLAGSSGVALLARREEPSELCRLDETPQWLR